MCKYPIKIHRYPNPKDDTPIYKDDGNPYYLVPCGRCVDCVRKRKNDWYVRARNEHDSGEYEQILWLSFTFRDDRLPSCRSDISAKLRAFKDRLRKKIGYFPTHFFISERGGHDQDGRIHLHGLLYMKTSIEYNVVRQCWSPFEGFCWIEPIESLKAITYCFKYAFKGTFQRIKGDCLTGYVWASLNFGHVTYERLMSWFCPSDDYNYIKGITYDSRFHYGIPRYLIGKMIRFVGIKKMQSYKDLLQTTWDYFLTRSERVQHAIALGQYFPKKQTHLLDYGCTANTV